MTFNDMREVRRCVVFATLMANGSGIAGKSPGYILQKFEQCFIRLDQPEILLDAYNRIKFDGWRERWEKEAKRSETL